MSALALEAGHEVAALINKAAAIRRLKDEKLIAEQRETEVEDAYMARRPPMPQAGDGPQTRDAWDAECERLKHELGLEALAGAHSDIGDLVYHDVITLADMPATTLPGLIAKASLFESYPDGDLQPHYHELALSVVRDLAALHTAACT